ncbi:MAG TPA: homoserine dehydrogenase [Acidimicrobiales bacterium]|nr:homoserine dehydrogenase [Acidimicrobiales bacterium]
MHVDPSVVRLGLLGCGNVGAALVRLLCDQADAIEARTGLRLEVSRVAVRNLAKARSVELPEGVLTHDADGVVHDHDVDLVVELVGGIEPARGLVLDALKAGKPVVTANKELIANVGSELFAAAEGAGVDLLFEAAVGGAIPIVRPLRESLAGSRIRRITGIVNGTTNYILTRMSEEGATYADALAEAQSLGYAERDPTADVEGYDAGAKAAILATIAFGASVVAGDVSHEGIAAVTPADIAFAHRLGYEIKLLAVAEHGDDGRIAVRVHPAMVPSSHPLASVRGSFNAVFIEGDVVGEIMLYGRGAGGGPTASAVLGDVVDAAGNLRRGTSASIGAMPRATIRPVDEVSSAYYLHLEVVDRPGVLHAVAGVFAEHEVSIRSMEQEGLGEEARLIFITHEAAESAVQATLRSLRRLDAVDRVTSVLRVVAG